MRRKHASVTGTKDAIGRVTGHGKGVDTKKMTARLGKAKGRKKKVNRRRLVGRD